MVLPMLLFKISRKMALAGMVEHHLCKRTEKDQE